MVLEGNGSTRFSGIEEEKQDDGSWWFEIVRA
jgi:hypothetical protein